MRKISKLKIQALQNKILSNYKKNKRDFPWRKTTDPYHILVSEIMLQQTQTDRVIKKYEEFIKKFPTISVLAKASLADVLIAWSGLGFNGRAKRLQDCAKEIAKMKSFPKAPGELQKLPGIGPYTSRSILIFAFNKDLACVDTNIRRILIHELHLKESISDKELQEIAESIVPRNKSRDWHNALMDYGAQILTSRTTGIAPKSTQSKFEGSNRWYRGQILKILAKEDSITPKNFSNRVNQPESFLQPIIEGMQKEGLIRLRNNKITLPR
ncbi:A/G-specific adenine glycosylase [Candidatus Woesearchaeota archaeon]|nr:A/G-specific adenine glycosylase [Candidatus Woesearchaeota archaeon]HIH37723.1 A/G-specific adenine glycosylase [Candidatus Woesearchaeota archaeon]HIJ04160.1 A/G-specific adenine glycosylase [Candidatus Woesearchaeota archaeon]